MRTGFLPVCCYDIRIRDAVTASMNRFVPTIILTVLLPGLAVAQRPPKRSEVRAERVRLFSSVILDWHVRNLAGTRTQQREWNTLLKGVARIHQKIRIGNPWPNTRRVDFRWFEFADLRSGAATQLLEGKLPDPGEPTTDDVAVARLAQWKTGLAKSLTASQQKRLDGQLRNRHEFRKTLMLEAALGRVQQAVRLTERQTAWLRDRLRQDPEMMNLTGDRFGIQCSQSIRTAMVQLEAREVFDRPKLARILDACRRQDSPNVAWIGFAPNDPESEHNKGIHIVLRKPLKRVSVSIDAEASYLVSQYSLTPQQERRLQVAARGTAIFIKRRWTSAAQAVIAKGLTELPEDREEDDEYHGPISTSFCLLDEGVWRNASRAVLGAGPNRQKLLDALAAEMMITLDAELWLDLRQRQPLRALIRKSINKFHSHDPVHQARAVLADVLNGTPQKELEQVLTKKQRDVWNYMRGMSDGYR